MAFWEKHAEIVASSEVWWLASSLFILPNSFYSTKTFFAAENGSTLAILGFPVFGLTWQLLGCLSRTIKTSSAAGNGIKSHHRQQCPVQGIAENQIFSCAPGYESLTRWPPFGICFLIGIDLSYVRWRHLNFLRDACLIPAELWNYFRCLYSSLGWSKHLHFCCHFKAIWNIWTALFFIFFNSPHAHFHMEGILMR